MYIGENKTLSLEYTALLRLYACPQSLDYVLDLTPYDGKKVVKSPSLHSQPYLLGMRYNARPLAAKVSNRGDFITAFTVTAAASTSTPTLTAAFTATTATSSSTATRA